jgi:hypothetical protein
MTADHLECYVEWAPLLLRTHAPRLASVQCGARSGAQQCLDSSCWQCLPAYQRRAGILRASEVSFIECSAAHSNRSSSAVTEFRCDRKLHNGGKHSMRRH